MSQAAVSALTVAQQVAVANSPENGNVPVWNSTTQQWEANGQPLGNIAPFADVASATTANIGAAASENVRITGTTTITGLGTAAAGTKRRVRFAGALTLTHNATSLILPGAANITTAANDCAFFVSLGSGNWICTEYQRASGVAVVSSGGGDYTWVVKSSNETRTNNATASADGGLLFAALANKKYLVKIGLQAGGPNDIKAAIKVPSLSEPQNTQGGGLCYLFGATDDIPGYGHCMLNITTIATAALTLPRSRLTGFMVGETVLTIGATPGNVEITWAQSSANASASTLYAGSFIAYKQLD